LAMCWRVLVMCWQVLASAGAGDTEIGVSNILSLRGMMKFTQNAHRGGHGEMKARRLRNCGRHTRMYNVGNRLYVR
jgi:hypothetical protein